MKKNMKKILIFTLISFAGYAQVGIGTSNPQGALEIVSTSDGLLIPKIALSNTTIATVLTPTKSELIYNTATTGDVTPGYYYWETTPIVASDRWIRLASATNNNWSLSGNNGTTVGTNFLGTTDAQDLRFKTGNIDRINISNTTGQLQSYAAGTANDPAFSWTSDSNTGIFNPTIDNIAIATTGVERTRILDNGDMGIGTPTPTHRLTIKNDIANAGVMNIDNGNSAGFGGIYFSEGAFSGTNYRGHIGHVNSSSGFAYPGTFQIASGDRDMLFSATNGSNSFTEIIRIENATGYVGINTNPLNLSAGIPLPTSTLHVNGSLAVGVLKITASTNLGTLVDEVSKVVVNNGAANITITFPVAANCKGRIISISRGESSTGTISCTTTGVGNLIQGLAGSLGGTTSIPAHSAAGAGVNIQFWSDGVNWYR